MLVTAWKWNHVHLSNRIPSGMSTYAQMNYFLQLSLKMLTLHTSLPAIYFNLTSLAAEPMCFYLEATDTQNWLISSLQNPQKSVNSGRERSLSQAEQSLEAAQPHCRPCSSSWFDVPFLEEIREHKRLYMNILLSTLSLLNLNSAVKREIYPLALDTAGCTSILNRAEVVNRD